MSLKKKNQIHKKEKRQQVPERLTKSQNGAYKIFPAYHNSGPNATCIWAPTTCWPKTQSHWSPGLNHLDPNPNHMLAQDSIALKSRTKSDLDPRPNLIWDQGQTPLGTRTKPHLGPGPTHAREQEWIPPPWSNHAWDQHQTAPGSKTQPHLSPAPNRTWVQDLTWPEPSTKPHLCPTPDPTQAQLQTTPGYQDLTRPRSSIESHLGSDQITIGMCHRGFPLFNSKFPFSLFHSFSFLSGMVYTARERCGMMHDCSWWHIVSVLILSVLILYGDIWSLQQVADVNDTW